MPLPVYDRSDYRCMSDERLVEESVYCPTPELAVVLGERLRKVRGLYYSAGGLVPAEYAYEEGE